MTGDFVDEVLRTYLAERRDAVVESAPLIEEIDRMLAAGGKRLRPELCLWGYRLAGGSDGREIASACAALELLHTFALVHDDIMDRSSTRRGVPTTYSSLGSDVAILVGDLALVLADDLFASCGFENREMERGLAAYSRMRQEVIAGQLLDLQGGPRAEIDEGAARRVAMLKSGRYSVVEPLLIGASLAGASDDLLDAIQAFAEPLGEAFQLRDDLLGTFGDPGATGKSADSDIRQGKRHVLFAKAVTGLPEDDRLELSKLWGDPDIDERGVARVHELIESSGARRECEILIAELLDRSLGALKNVAVPKEVIEALTDLARRAVDRDT